MNVVPVHAPDTLPIIFERGLVGTYHDWCEPFSTYPRSYDLLHADHLFSRLKNRYRLTFFSLLLRKSVFQQNMALLLKFGLYEFLTCYLTRFPFWLVENLFLNPKLVTCVGVPWICDLINIENYFCRCNQPVRIVVEMDRMLRPGGWTIIRDKVEILGPLEGILKSLNWDIRLTYAQDKEGIICAQKNMWRP